MAGRFRTGWGEEAEWLCDDWVFLVDEPDDEWVSGNAIVVAVDGGCRNEGKPWAESAYAVYFGEDNEYNESERLLDDNPTSQLAQLWGAMHALWAVQRLAREWPHPTAFRNGRKLELQRVIVKADSEYLVRGMTEWVFDWEDNGWKTAYEQDVVNGGLFKMLVNQVRTL